MGYMLRWRDTNRAEDGHRIYRSTSPMDPENLPAPLALVGPDVTEFEDTTAEEDVLYYYRVSAFKGASEAVSAEAQADVEGGGTDPGGLPDTIGEFFGGGYYIGNITIPDGPDAGEYAVIMAGAEGQATAQWKTASSNTPDTGSTEDGMANTLAMEAAGLAAHPAAAHCRGYRGGGHDDWYMPARDELSIAWENRAALAGLAMEAQRYWSSMQSTSSNAWRQSFDDGLRGVSNKTGSFRVRPVRRLKI